MKLNIIYDGPRRGDVNMALDILLLEESSLRKEAYLRLYTWTPTTLSLGRRQEAIQLIERARNYGFQVVRRPTGGTGLLHVEGSELTYAITLPVGHPLFKLDVASSASIIAREIAKGLRESLGVEVKAGRPEDIVAPWERPQLCLEAHGAGDLKIGNVKIGGAAQLRTSRGILQHGQIILHYNRDLWSIVFGDSPRDLKGLLDIVESNLIDIAEAVAIGVSRLPGIEEATVSYLPGRVVWRAEVEASRFRVEPGA